mgnify:CR=1 FL=1
MPPFTPQTIPTHCVISKNKSEKGSIVLTDTTSSGAPSTMSFNFKTKPVSFVPPLEGAASGELALLVAIVE